MTLFVVKDLGGSEIHCISEDEDSLLLKLSKYQKFREWFSYDNDSKEILTVVDREDNSFECFLCKKKIDIENPKDFCQCGFNMKDEDWLKFVKVNNGKSFSIQRMFRD